MRSNLTLVLLTALALSYAPENCGTAADPPPAKKPDGSARTPPDIKEGVRVRFAGLRVYANITGEGESPTVEKVQANWVYLKGAFFVDSEKQSEGWVNFDTVSWYRIVTK